MTIDIRISKDNEPINSCYCCFGWDGIRVHTAHTVWIRINPLIVIKQRWAICETKYSCNNYGECMAMQFNGNGMQPKASALNAFEYSQTSVIILNVEQWHHKYHIYFESEFKLKNALSGFVFTHVITDYRRFCKHIRNFGCKCKCKCVRKQWLPLLLNNKHEFRWNNRNISTAFFRIKEI